MLILTGIIIFLTTVLYFGKKYAAGGVCKILKDLTGKIVLITGANTGIGKETAYALAKMNATIIFACRDPKRSIPVVEELKQKTGNRNLEFMQLDLSDLKSVKLFAENFKNKYSKLHILINNAGIMMLPDRHTTKDGFEMQFGTNHLGHFYLIKLLLDVIEKSSPSRIVNVASKAYEELTKINWDDIMSEKDFNFLTSYSQSKLGNILTAKELQRRFDKEGKDVKIVSLHPGVIQTELTRYVSGKWYMELIACLLPIVFFFGKTPVQGAQTTLYCALEDQEKLEGGKYYSDCKVKKETELVSEENAQRMWELSEALISKALTK